ncbi:hypothetical protein [Allopontixanthobacter sediminis]|uniref:Uncharacterized protein n=1 Tax=Allopontixanthobacter sediminis TaxID=1689985 RepID=A0A845B0N9_9SPHN|nr:hypothetical protein [Allopontixanthobacter sediminis]MXP43242.1 hypothetical protein [Allopontixanthobacter sediminis]
MLREWRIAKQCTRALTDVLDQLESAAHDDRVTIDLDLIQQKRGRFAKERITALACSPLSDHDK